MTKTPLTEDELLDLSSTCYVTMRIEVGTNRLFANKLRQLTLAQIVENDDFYELLSDTLRSLRKYGVPNESILAVSIEDEEI